MVIQLLLKQANELSMKMKEEESMTTTDLKREGTTNMSRMIGLEIPRKEEREEGTNDLIFTKFVHNNINYRYKIFRH